jgi:hypothetical protein
MAAVNPMLLKLLDHTLAELPTLARQVLESTSNSIQGSARHFALQEPWAKRRNRFLMEFESDIRPQLAQLRQGALPNQPRMNSFDGLSLVDEHQALRDVGIAHAVELCSEASRQELFQLNNFFNALYRGSQGGRDSNALRPALFARALVNALAGADLNAEGHFALVKVAAPGWAQALAGLYGALASLLQAADLTALVSTRQGQERPRQRGFRETGPGALADWHSRSQSITSRPRSLIQSDPSEAARSMLDRLYERILADPALSTPVKAQLARLQVAVARLSRDDPSLLRREDHPTWRVINAVAAYAGGFANPNDLRLDAFLRFLEDHTQPVIESAEPTAAQFEYLMRLIDAFIARQAKERSEPSKAALARVEREQQRPAWLKMLREQFGQQARALGLGRTAGYFLIGPWADLIVQAMVHNGHDAPAIQPLLATVDDLEQSLQAPTDNPQRERLRRELPGLVSRLESAMETAQLPEARRKSLLLELMQIHGRLLTGPLRAERKPAAPAPSTPAPQPADSHRDEPDETEVSRFVEERESAYASVWAYAQVDRAALPTQPLPLPSAGETELRSDAQVWLDQLRVGGWFHLFVDGGWETAQLVWINAERKLFLFIPQDSDLRQSLTEGALTQLHLNGLVMYLDQEGLLERAVSTLMQDL